MFPLSIRLRLREVCFGASFVACVLSVWVHGYAWRLRFARRWEAKALIADRQEFVRDHVSKIGYMDNLCIGIKHISSFPNRKLKVKLLLESLRQYNSHHRNSLDIIVADDGSNPSNYDGARLILTNRTPGLSAGRNALVAACKRPYIAIMDDDVLVTNHTKIFEMTYFLEKNKEYDLIGGCYGANSISSLIDSCYAQYISISNFTVETYPVKYSQHAIVDADIVHNFFVARTHILKRYKWDARMQMMEHDFFFLQLKLANRRIACMSDSVIFHNRSSVAMDLMDGYIHSARNKERRFHQYTCSAFPRFAQFFFQWTQLHCKQSTYCTPVWRNGKYHFELPWTCKRFEENGDDHSIVSTSYAEQKTDLFVGILSHYNAGLRRQHVRWTLLQKTHYFMEERKESQRRHHRRRSSSASAPISNSILKWNYAFFVGVGVGVFRHRQKATRDPTGDIVYLACPDTYEKLGQKVVTMLQWWHANVDSKYFLKIDIDTWFHPGKIMNWLVSYGSEELFYGGDVNHNAEVVRADMKKTNFERPETLPDDFLKWQVDYRDYPGRWYPAYAKGGAYILSKDVVRALAQYFQPQNRPVILNNVEDVMVALAIYKTIPSMKVQRIPGFCELSNGTKLTKDKDEYCQAKILAFHKLPFHLWC